MYFVGAGPGHAGLITLRGCRCLARADAVLFDYLVDHQVLSHAPPQAQRISLGHHGRERVWSQDEINRKLVELAQAGRTVVRLKGGDPLVFAHALEEVQALVAAGIEFEIVPGVTAAMAAASFAGVPLTQGDAASAVALVTGQERADKPASALDFAALATFPGTLAIYMGVTTAEHWTGQLMAHGKPADTPAVIVRRASWPDQLTVPCTLGTVAAEIRQRRLRPPVVVLVGEVARVSPALNWFRRRPLFGQVVVVTRPAEQSAGLVERLEDLGARVLVQPAIEIGPPADWGPLDAALARLHEFDWLVFSSANGVQSALQRLLDSGRDVRALGGVKLAAIGPATAEALARFHLRGDLVPEEYRAEALAAALAGEAAGKRLLVIRASRGREVLAEQLQAAGGRVEQVVAYTSRDVPAPQPEVAAALAEQDGVWVTVTSSAIARSLRRLFGERLRAARLASISPVTSGTLRELGCPPAVEAGEYTTDGLVAAILDAARCG